jgi:hypothetical protein
MIKYSLKCIEENCKKNEPFDGWFQNSASFEKQIDMMVILRNLKKEIQKNAEFVGKNFTKEAKAIQEGKSKERAIYGHADAKDLKELNSKNIDFIKVPWIQDDN